MTDTATEIRSVVTEREMPFPPEKIWRALTQPHLIEAWLMKNERNDQGAGSGRQRHVAGLKRVTAGLD